MMIHLLVLSDVAVLPFAFANRARVGGFMIRRIGGVS
jgi:hypothetical protein